jgi:hypothetical protein
MRLAELQRAMQARVLRGDPTIEAFVVGTTTAPARVRLGIYEHAFAARLAEALAQTFSALRTLLGERKFAELARAYAASMPPRHFSIRWFGSGIADFIAAGQIGPRGRGLAGLARFEWALAQAFDAADATPLTKAALGAVPAERWPGLRFRFVPSLRRLTLATNAVAWWRGATGSGPRPRRWRDAQPVEWLIWRNELTTRFRSMAPEEAAALRVACNGGTFAELCAQLLERHGADIAPTRAVVLLQAWFNDGLIVDVRSDPEP